jgi:hypothetical protein
LENLFLSGWSNDRKHPDMVGNVKGRSVNPQGSAQTESRPMHNLAEAGNVLQTLFDYSSSRLQLESTIGTEESLTVEDDESADVHRLTEIARVQHEQIIGG